MSKLAKKNKISNGDVSSETNIQAPAEKQKSKGFLETFLGPSKGASKRGEIKKTAQDTVPYCAAFKNGIIETSPGNFSKSYKLEDVNFKIATQEEQENIFSHFGDLLNMFGADVTLQISMLNRNVDKEKFCNDVLMKFKGDNLDVYREESNKILLEHMNEGHNSLVHEKYLTVSVKADNIDDATTQFSRLDSEVSNAIKRINNTDTFPMKIEERLSLMHDFFNPDAELSFDSEIERNGKVIKAFDFDALARQGLSTKDIVCPDSFKFAGDHFMIGNKYARTVFLDNLPAYLSTDFISSLNDVPSHIVTSVIYEPLRQDKSVKLIKNQMVNINANVVDAQKKASKSGYSVDLISPDLMKAQEEASKLLEDMTSRNQKMFFVTIVIAIVEDTQSDLDKTTKILQTNAQKYLCSLKKLTYQQEQGLATALPLGINQLEIKRLLTTESASLFIPFAAQELTQSRGMYYGLNAVSRNLILFNRLSSKNANAVILGTPGSGKSFSAKREILNVILNTDADVYIIDPEREYAPMAKMLNGEIVRIAAGSKNYINPLDMDIAYADDEDPITLKSDFIGSLCETVIGGHYGLSPVQKSVIDRCVRQVYQPYLKYMQTAPAGVTCDKAHTPTLMEFYELLLAQPEPEAQSIALALELYCTGSLDTFAHHTNVNTSSRFVVYDIKDIGSQMKEMGLQVCLNDIWNKIIENKQKYGKRTWFYIDEFYLLTQTDSSARFLQQVYKRARKWLGVPTGITQNVEDLLASKEARGIINNCDFIMMLNQSPLDRIQLGEMLNISPSQMSYITNADCGQGLLYTGKSIVPFIDKYPRDTLSYKAMTTKMEDFATGFSSITEKQTPNK